MYKCYRCNEETSNILCPKCADKFLAWAKERGDASCRGDTALADWLRLKEAEEQNGKKKEAK